MLNQGAFECFGHPAFLADYGVKHGYVAGAMYKGIASADMTVAMAKAGLLSFFGAGGLSLAAVEKAIVQMKTRLGCVDRVGMNMLANFEQPEKEMALIDLYLRHGIRVIEAASYVSLSLALVYYRVSGLRVNGSQIECQHKIMAKISRPEVARKFLSPPPAAMVNKLVEQGLVSAQQAALAQCVPMADDICVEADSGGHTDQGIITVLLPAIKLLATQINTDCHYEKPVRVGAAGGLGTPNAMASAMLLGADFILTGSINQCTVEADTSDAAKDMLAEAQVQDMAIIPAGDMFELGAKVQVLRKGNLFHARANKLYDIYRHYASLEDLPPETLTMIEQQILGRSIADVWQETASYYQANRPEELLKAEKSAKHRMAMVFKWYFVHGSRLARQGDPAQRVNFQIQCGPSLGAFNAWVKNTRYENWRNRHVAEIAALLIEETLGYLRGYFLSGQMGVGSEEGRLVS